MSRNEALQAELIKTLEKIKKELKSQGKMIYEKELNELSEAIHKSLTNTHKSSFFEKEKKMS